MNQLRHEFLKSACMPYSFDCNLAESLRWLKDQNELATVKVERVPVSGINKWRLDRRSGKLIHDNGHFFSIEGIRVTTNWGHVQTWDQPIINQAEIGYLGFIAKKFNGVLHFLMQAKIEPGNVNHVQLSPTIQATRSNYTQAHGGRKPLYLEFFQNVAQENVLLDQLQSEQGARFLMKRNRNIIIQVDDNLPVYENFIWLTLGHVKELLRYDNLVNMDTRTVLSGISYGDLDAEAIRLLQFFINGMGVRKESPALMMSAMQSSGSLNTINDIIHFLTKIKSKYDLIIDKISLWDAKSWVVSDDAISREDGKFFKVIGVNVSISNREVLSWQQPMVQPSHEGICGFVCKTINGVIHFAVQAKLECGNRDIIELAPTVQCLTGDYRAADSHPVPFLEYLLNAPEYSILYDAFQSEEGGRFFCEQNRNLIVMAGDDFPIDLPDNFIWMTLSQLIFFNQFNNYLNIQARSLIAAISLI